MNLPRLITKGSFQFHENAKDNITQEYKKWLENDLAIDIIIKIIRMKLSNASETNRIYFLQGRTGSGKSTIMISSLYESIIKGSNCKLICSEPRVVLTESNANEVISRNKNYKLGVQMGIQSGAMKVIPSEIESMNYYTTQILSDTLLNIINISDLNTARRKLSKIKIIIVDEVHTLDIAMMSLLKVILDILEKFGKYQECPIFIFASATIDTNQLSKYYFKDNTQILSDPLIYGFVGGTSNFDIKELFIEDSIMSKYNNEESQKNEINYAFKIISRHFYDNFYKDLWNSKSYIKNVQCRDVLIFVPLVAGIETIGTQLEIYIKDKPVMFIKKGEFIGNVMKWRNMNRNKKRILIVGFARDYSLASDYIISTSIDPDNESLENETKIFIATSVLETGKTIYTLHLCIDMGLDTTTINNPLSMNHDNIFKYIRQLPANLNQTIQRKGRMGRVAPGTYLHFYSQEIMKKFQNSDIPQTINSSCLSGLLLKIMRKYSDFSVVDIANENDYLFPTSLDIIIKSAQDLISAGFLTTFNELTEFRIKRDISDIWMLYAKYLYIIVGMPLFDSLLLALINMKKLPPFFTVRDFNRESLQIKIENIMGSKYPTTDIIDSIQKARNYITIAKYSKISPFTYISSKIF